MNEKNTLLIGRGRWARHLLFYAQQVGVSFTTWNRDQSGDELNSLLQSKTQVLLAISDSSLDEMCSQILNLKPGVQVVHFSGSLLIQGAVCVHPLMTFTHEIYDFEFYKKIPFALTGVSDLQKVFPYFQNPYFTLPAEKKSIYHALCVVGGNFSTLLIQQMLIGFSELGLEPAWAEPYLEKIVANVLKHPHQALSGPLARRDLGTIQANLSALRGTNLFPLYLSMMDAFTPDLRLKIEKNEGV